MSSLARPSRNPLGIEIWKYAKVYSFFYPRGQPAEQAFKSLSYLNSSSSSDSIYLPLQLLPFSFTQLSGLPIFVRNNMLCCCPFPWLDSHEAANFERCSVSKVQRQLWAISLSLAIKAGFAQAKEITMKPCSNRNRNFSIVDDNSLELSLVGVGVHVRSKDLRHRKRSGIYRDGVKALLLTPCNVFSLLPLSLLNLLCNPWFGVLVVIAALFRDGAPVGVGATRADNNSCATLSEASISSSPFHPRPFGSDTVCVWLDWQWVCFWLRVRCQWEASSLTWPKDYCCAQQARIAQESWIWVGLGCSVGNVGSFKSSLVRQFSLVGFLCSVCVSCAWIVLPFRLLCSSSGGARAQFVGSMCA